MPDRIVRDELLRSPRYRSLSSDTLRVCFVHLLLTVDSLGNTEAHTLAVSDMMRRPVTEEEAAKWLAELADVDLVRIYVVDGKRYVHVPRFRQRLRHYKRAHPRPPAAIECTEIRALLEKVGLKSDHGRTSDGLRSAEVKRSEGKKNNPPPASQVPPKGGTAADGKGTRLPQDWALPRKWGEWALGLCPEWSPEKVRDVAAEFRDFWLGVPGKAGRKADWEATWRNRVREVRGRELTRGGGGSDGKAQRRSDALDALTGHRDAGGAGDGGPGGRVFDAAD